MRRGSPSSSMRSLVSASSASPSPCSTVSPSPTAASFNALAVDGALRVPEISDDTLVIVPRPACQNPQLERRWDYLAFWQCRLEDS